jgi:hypothetical protein
MFLWHKHLDRRTFLRGMGATVGLPLLDAMLPRLSWARPVPRLAFVYFPHGAIMDEWTPALPKTGQGVATARQTLTLGRILEPLTPFRHQLTVVDGLENRHAYGPVHAITPGTWLAGTSPRRGSRDDRTRGSASLAGARSAEGGTADQLAADHFGGATPMRALAVATEEPQNIHAGIWQGEYDESYGTTISFRQAHVPVPMQFRPRAIFDALFRSSTAADQDETRAAQSTSILDLVADEAASLRKRLGPADRAVLGEYLERVREIEQRIDRVDRRSGSVADRFPARMSLMFDMIALAFRADITRVASVMMAAETSSMTYDHLGVSEPFHLLSHHQNDPEKIEKLVRIQTFHTQMFATFVRTLAELPDGDGSILDRSLILFGSNMSSSHAHDHFPLPAAVVGGGCGTHRGGQHLRYSDRTPVSNLLLTMLHRSGVPVPSIGDSTCECAEL